MECTLLKNVFVTKIITYHFSKAFVPRTYEKFSTKMI